jgi:hypothetical protein
MCHMLDAAITPRLERRIRAIAGDGADAVFELLGQVESGNQDRERVLAAVVLGAGDDVARLGRLVALSRVDWRDVLVSGGLANADWPARLDALLGPPDAPAPG